MGKGDIRSRKGKIFAHSFGNRRLRRKAKPTPGPVGATPKR